MGLPALQTPPGWAEPLTGQHGNEGKAAVLGAAPVASFSEHVSVEYLVIQLLDPGLGEDHEHPAALHLLHELFLQRGHMSRGCRQMSLPIIPFSLNWGFLLRGDERGDGRWRSPGFLHSFHS